MSKYSYQDQEVRLTTLEKKVDLILSFMVVTKREPNRFSETGYADRKMTGLELYRELATDAIETSVEESNGTDR